MKALGEGRYKNRSAMKRPEIFAVITDKSLKSKENREIVSRVTITNEK